MACADMECSMRVHSNCESCVMKVHDVLRSVRGVYSVDWDVEEKLFKISGEVEPSVILKAVLRTGNHAEFVKVKIKHPQLRKKYYNSPPYGPPMPIGGYNNLPYYRDAGYIQYNPYIPPRVHYEPPPLVDYPSSHVYALPQANYVPSYSNATTSDHVHPLQQANYVPSYNNATTSDHVHPLPQANYVTSYPSQEQNAYANYESISPCTIM